MDRLCTGWYKPRLLCSIDVDSMHHDDLECSTFGYKYEVT